VGEGVVNYEAKELPAWVRFKANALQKQVYGPPTWLEHMMIKTAAAWSPLMADRLIPDNKLIGMLSKGWGVDR
jgi:hypothetical protein